MMKYLLKFTLISIFASLLSCEKTDISPQCQLTRFSTFTTASNATHFDNFIFKNDKISQIQSYDYRHTSNDTINKYTFTFIYNADGLLAQLREAWATGKLYTFDYEYDTSEKPIKVTQKTDGVWVQEFTVQFKKDLIETVNSTSLVGLNRAIDYDVLGNPKTLIRYDTNPISFSEFTFDSQNNFFAGIPEIKYLWIARPLFNFLPFGNHNIESVRVFNLRGSSLVEEPTLKSTRILAYNAQGFPINIKRLNDNSNNALISESKFEYKCK